MIQPTLKTEPTRRIVAKEKRREQLIKATINSVAKRGLAGTTMAVVTKEAGLSLGIVNLHFQSKDKLLIDTLQYLSEEYATAYQNVLVKAGPGPAEKLAALVELDFSNKVCERKKLAVWFAFWGEAKSRPTYMQICANNDNKYDSMIGELCEQLVTEGNYTHIKPQPFALGLAAMVDGLWLDLLMTPDKMTTKLAKEICFDYLAHTFPGHFK